MLQIGIREKEVLEHLENRFEKPTKLKWTFLTVCMLKLAEIGKELASIKFAIWIGKENRLMLSLYAR